MEENIFTLQCVQAHEELYNKKNRLISHSELQDVAARHYDLLRGNGPGARLVLFPHQRSLVAVAVVVGTATVWGE